MKLCSCPDVRAEETVVWVLGDASEVLSLFAGLVAAWLLRVRLCAHTSVVLREVLTSLCSQRRNRCHLPDLLTSWSR